MPGEACASKQARQSLAQAAHRHRLQPIKLCPVVIRFRILRNDDLGDGLGIGIAGQIFASYDEAYAVLERYYADLCCSDDRQFYQIVEDPIEQET